MVIDAVVEDQQRAFRREHAHRQVRIFRYTLAPDPRRVNHYGGIQLAVLVVLRIKHPHPTDAMTFANKPGHFMSGQNACAMLTGVQHVGGGQAERIDGTVRDFHRADKRRVDRRFQPPRQRRIHGLRLNARGSAGGNKGVLKGEVIFGKGNKEAVGRLNAVACDTLEDLVFSNTFARGFRVGDRIPGAAVQQAVVPSGCARGDIMAFQKRNA